METVNTANTALTTAAKNSTEILANTVAFGVDAVRHINIQFS